jgi:hypothetical protein
VTQAIHTLVANYSTAIRTVKVDGKEYIVAPGTLMVEGSHPGTAGPVNYSSKLLKSKPERWNNKPIVLNHPQDADGTYVPFDSDPSFKDGEVGFVNNSVYKGKLRTEYWYDVEKSNKVDARIVKNLKAGTPMGTSIGLADAKVNKFRTGKDRKGVAYKGEVTDYTADHVALLLDKKPACDIEHGCGCLVNCECGEGKTEIVANEQSFSRIRSQLDNLIYQKYGYSAYKDNELFQLGYTVNVDTVELSDEKPVAVKWVTEYRTLTGEFVGNCASATLVEIKKENPEMDKTQRIVAIIANGQFTEADRPWLEKQDEAVLAKLTPKTVQAAQVVPVVNNATLTPTTPIPVVPVVNQPESLESYIAKAPPALQSAMRRMVNNENSQKAQVVANIMASPGNTFSQETLLAQPLETLQGLERLALGSINTQQVIANNYMGLAPQAIAPRGPAKEEEPLATVAWDFAPAK